MKKEFTDMYRFDDAYGNVYKFYKGLNAYVFHCSYFAVGIDKSMSNSEKEKIVENRSDVINF